MVLGIAGKFGPLSTYGIRKHFADSPSTHFSDSAGSIYPVVERLEEAGLLRSRADPRGRQPRRLYELTPAGRGAVEAWLARTPDAETIDPPPDPIRTRLYFLQFLPRPQQRRMLDRLIDELEAKVEELRAYARRQRAEPVSGLAADGMTAVTRARLRWLRRVRAALFP